MWTYWRLDNNPGPTDGPAYGIAMIMLISNGILFRFDCLDVATVT